MKRDWKNAFPPVDEDFKRSMDCAFEEIRKENRKVKKKVGIGFILAAALLLSAAAIAVSQWDLFRLLTHTATPIVPLDGAEKLVETNLGSVENEWVTVAVEQAACDGQGVYVMARITPKDPEHFELFNAMMMDAPEDVYEVSHNPVPVPEGTEETDAAPPTRIVNEPGNVALFVGDERVEIPDSREDAEAAGLPVYMDGGVLCYAEQEIWEVTGRKDGRPLLDFDADLRPVSDDEAVLDIINGMGFDAEAQEDGSVLVWFDGFAETSLPEAIDMRLTVRVTPPGAEAIEEEIVFSLANPGEGRTARYVPEGDGIIGDHVRVREVRVNLTQVRAYLTVEYEYVQRPEEDMGVWLHPYDIEGNPINTGSGIGSSPEEAQALGFWRQQDEMQSFDEIPGVIVLEAKAIGGEPLGRCVCRLDEGR